MAIRLVVSLVLLLSALPAAAQSYDQIVRQHTDSVPFSGVVLVGRGDRTVYVRGLGFADHERKIATTPETRYQLGSISKWICSLAVLRLHDEGRLDVQAPIAEYLPNFRRDNAARLTLHHLMSHTSGVPNDIIPAIGKTPGILGETIAADEVIRRYASGDLAFEPGSRWEYSHSNWLLVRRVIERASGEPVERAVRRLLFDPLQLRNTGIVRGDFGAIPHAALPYRTITPQPVRRDAQPMPDFVECMGGSYATAPDLLRLMDAVYSGGLLTARSLAAMNAVHAAEQEYGYGGRTHTLKVGDADRKVAWQSGSNGAYKSVAYRDLADGTTVIVLSNTSPSQDRLSALAEALLRAAYGAR